jgi:hypothetical protein
MVGEFRTLPLVEVTAIGLIFMPTNGTPQNPNICEWVIALFAGLAD